MHLLGRSIRIEVNPGTEGRPDRYVLCAEGTTDETCLGILRVTRP